VTGEARASSRQVGISFAGNSPWVACSQLEMGLWAQRDDIAPRAVRVLFAALAKVDRTGHSPFASGELAALLGSVDPRTGVLSRARPDAVSDAIAHAKRLGFIARESSARCLVVHGHAFQRASGASRTCAVHVRELAQ
jgi:hypothetical protein